MLFVDGENLTLRAQEYAGRLGLELEPGNYFMKDVFLWLADRPPYFLQRIHQWHLEAHVVRAYYYTSLVGDDDKLQSVRRQLRHVGFDPQVFKKTSGQMKSKGVDITLTKDMLSHAFLDHYEAAVLIAGDADYVPLIDEIKRRGKNIYVAFFQEEGLGLSPELRLRADGFHALDDDFAAAWRSWIARRRP